MNPQAAVPLPDAAFALCLALLLLAPLAIAGVALINTGLGRCRSAAQALLGNLAIVAVSAIVFALVGATLAGNLPSGPGGAGHILFVRQALELAGRGFVSARRARGCSGPVATGAAL